jgi:hypothetical protein
LSKAVLWHLLETEDVLPFADALNLRVIHCLIGYHILAHVSSPSHVNFLLHYAQ